MNFSELFKQTNQLSRFSPNEKYLVSYKFDFFSDLFLRVARLQNYDNNGPWLTYVHSENLIHVSSTNKELNYFL